MHSTKERTVTMINPDEPLGGGRTDWHEAPVALLEVEAPSSPPADADVMSPAETDWLEVGEAAARATYSKISEELKQLRDAKDAIQTRINELVEADQIWGPIINRLDNGIKPRRRRVEPEVDELVVDDGEVLP